MWQQHLWIAVLWVLYCTVHSVLATTRVKKAVQQGRPQVANLYRLGYNLLAFGGLAAIILLQIKTPSPFVFEATTAVYFVAGLLAGTGVAIMAVCIRKYFTGLSGLRNLWQEDVKDQLIVSGIHKAVRHPLYLGTFLALWGSFLALPTLSFLLSNIVITAYTLIGIGFEEKKLIAAFGDDYIRYKKTVPKLIPRIGHRQ